MSLNIKNPKTYQLAKKVAELTGESMAQAVTTALEERMAKLEQEDRLARLTEIAKSCAQHLNEGSGELMTAEDLYDDETGLPK